MSTPFPRVSIGMPVFNGERYIKQVIDSILAQTYTDFEFIISDNGSSDAGELPFHYGSSIGSFCAVQTWCLCPRPYVFGVTFTFYAFSRGNGLAKAWEGYRRRPPADGWCRGATSE